MDYPAKLTADAGEQPAQSEAAQALQAGRVHDLAGRLDEAAHAYEAAANEAAISGARPVLVEALRRLAVIRHRRSDRAGAQNCGAESYREAVILGDLILAGEALNALAGFEFEEGKIAAARASYLNALALAGSSASLLGKIEQNLGILESVQGNHAEAYAHYRRALEAFRQQGDEAGVASAHHNLGVTASRRGDWDEAERSLTKSAVLAAHHGDVFLQGLCELHRAEVAQIREHYSDALTRAERALTSFERLGDHRAMSDAYKVIGKILRESGRLALAEDRLQHALQLAVESGWILGQAEAARELARLHLVNGRKQEALNLFREAYDLFGRLAARLDLQDVAQRITELAA